MAAWWKRTWKVFRISELLPSHNKIYRQLFTEGDKLSRTPDTHQYLHASSCHVYHSKKSILYSQALRLNRICSENLLYDKRCNGLEVWLREQGYGDKLVRQQILKARKRKRKELVNDMEDKRNDYKLVLNITYHLNFSNLKDTMSFLHFLLTPDKEHQQVFHKVPIIRFPLLVSEERKVWKIFL